MEVIYLLIHAVPVVVLLGVAAFGMWLWSRNRLWGGVVVLLGIGPMFVPALVGRADALLTGQAMQRASVWPPEIDLAGKNVLLVTIAGSSCEICDDLLIRSDAARIDVVGLEHADWEEPDRAGLKALKAPGTEGSLLVRSTESVPPGGAPVAPYADFRPDLLPDRVDLVIVTSSQDFFVLHQTGPEPFSERRRGHVRFSIHVYGLPDGRIDRFHEGVLLGRLLQARPPSPDFVMPLGTTPHFHPAGGPLNEKLSRWACGADAPPDCMRFFPGGL
ncbi:hypothetical protein JQC91_11015 [Jannaschia sp. Os4]|uniref:hypothetical protein n=1 Tax=Jannaschia sp. Os4 TaxID=2807617 RepID=UPI00193A06CD|nr:hypothetical protein [Jannaschia sp. Os4]MBM2576834.1 hypothetical protein [Jannaschia sp. Os4]